jgi:hypothetical protein
MLFAFQHLEEPGNPFHPILNGMPVDRFYLREWLADPNQFAWLVQLLNRSLNKLTGRRHLHLDKDHNRYFFPAIEQGVKREVSYRPLNKSKATRRVVWEPINKKTGAGRGYWYHRAISLRFERFTSNRWCLALRPELRVTKDGFKPLESLDVGARVTKKTSRTFNYNLLTEVQFWRDYLGESRPRIVLPFGSPKQVVVISCNLMQGGISWPGIPPEHAKPFKNVEYLDDLFSWAERDDLDEDALPDSEEWIEEGDDADLDE